MTTPMLPRGLFNATAPHYTPNQAIADSGTGDIHALTLPGGRWTGLVTAAPYQAGSATERAWMVFLAALNGKAGRFRMPVTSYRFGGRAAGRAATSPPRPGAPAAVGADAVAGARQIRIRNWLPMAGDYITLSGRHLHIVTAGRALNGVMAEVTLHPPLLADQADNAPVEVAMPFCEAQATDIRQASLVDGSRLFGGLQIEWQSVR